MNSPRISVVIPVYNVEKYLERSLESVLAQTVDPYEVILVDDGSTDHSGEICDRYAESHEGWKVVHKKNGGLGMARNTGMDIAGGTHIIWLDSDDTLQPYTIDLYCRVLAEIPDVDMAIGGFEMVSEKNPMPSMQASFQIESLDSDTVQYAFLLRKIRILAPGTLYSLAWLRREHLRYDTIPYSEDQLFLWQAMAKVKKAVVCKDIVYNYLVRPGSLMTASKYDSIRRCYSYFEKLEKELNNHSGLQATAKKYFFARWVYGILHSSAKLCTPEEYTTLLKDYEANRHFRLLRDFPDIRVRIMAGIYAISKGLFYKISRRF